MKILLISISLVIGFISCNPINRSYIEESWDIVAHWKIIKEDSVIVADVDKVKAKMNIPLDVLVEDYSVVKLDNKALLTHRMSDAFISDNFIAISCYSYHPLKLFKKDGIFIGDIGSLGPEEKQYDCIHDIQIDEKNNKVYILPAYLSNPNRILVYDLQGTLLSEIPLINKVRVGGSFKINTSKNEITVINTSTKLLPNPFRVWIQDLNGNLIKGIPANKASIDIPISGTMTSNHTEAMEMFLMYGGNSTGEYLYHYDDKKNKLVPKFHVKTQENRIFIYELPFHYIIEVVSLLYNNTPKFIVHKKTLKGCQFTGFVTPEGLLLDQYAILNGCHDGYFSLVEQESRILEQIQKIDKNNLTKEQIKNLNQLQRMIEEDEEDGYLLFMAKFKK